MVVFLLEPMRAFRRIVGQFIPEHVGECYPLHAVFCVYRFVL